MPLFVYACSASYVTEGLAPGQLLISHTYVTTRCVRRRALYYRALLCQRKFRPAGKQASLAEGS